MAVAKKGFEFFLNRLLKGFRSVEKREPNNLEMILIRQEAGKKAVDANKVIEVNFGKPFNEEIEAMIKSGDVNVGTAPKTPPYQKSQADIEFEIMEKIKADNEKAIKAFESRNPNKPRDEKYTGGMVDVEPSLSDIGHGSDALMARTRLISPGAQGTTSTGLNYLLAEDNDNIRVPFSAGGGGRRAFLKLLATMGGGIAGIKSGLIGMGGKEATKKAVTETVKSAGSGTPPPYFFKLVEKIKLLGDDVTEKAATTERQKVTRFKDYEITEDLTTGEQTIQKKSIEGEFDTPVPTSEEVYMNYKPGAGQADEGTKGIPADEYVEDTSYVGTSRGNKGEIIDTHDGVPDEVIMEVEAGSGNVPESFYTGPDKIKKAEGGRIDFSAGGLANVLARLGITGSSRRFLEKAFGKENFENMIKNDPDMHRGLLEVVEMFRNRDKEGLKMYMQKFLPHMDDATVEDFIIGSDGTEGIAGQLIRLGSGRDYKGKLEMIKEAGEKRKLFDLNVTDEMKRKPNASGGIQTMLGE